IVKEALACGVPVVSTRVGDVPRLIISPYLGQIVDTFTDEVIFADALIKMLSIVKNNPTEVRITCRKMALNNFGFDKIAKKFIKIYNMLLTKTSR
ncbi:MAG: glycosyltransferase, partial [Candidatus Asgardarchaeia archaeon]